MVQDYDALRTQGATADAVYQAIHADAVRLGGRLDDMTQRAVVYHHLFAISGGNFIFPLIAAHGALWARWYLIAAASAAHVLSVVDVTTRQSRADKMRAYNAFVAALKAVNRDVMVETYTIFHFSRLYGRHPILERLVSEPLLSDLLRCQDLVRSGGVMPPQQQRTFYENFFRWEQQRVVGPVVDQAFARFEWPLMKQLCMRPWIWFSYFRVGRSLVFKNFADAEERVGKGMAAYDWAASKGWPAIAANLTRNPLFPKTFSIDPSIYFSGFPAHGAPPHAALDKTRQMAD
jgi:hypothetical protein